MRRALFLLALACVPDDAGAGLKPISNDRKLDRKGPARTAGGAASPVCGNGAVEGSEACDDGGTAAGDGCSATCTVEVDFSCVGSPSVCTYPYTCVVSIPGANGDGIVLADSAGLEPTNGMMGWCIQWLEISTASADAVIAKFTEGGTAAFVIDQTSCTGSPVRCQYRADLCHETTCATTPRIHTSPKGVLTNQDWTTVCMAMDTGASDLGLYVGGAEVTVTTSGVFTGGWQDIAGNWTVANRSGPGTRAPNARIGRITYWRNVRPSDQCIWDWSNPIDQRGRGNGPIPASCPAPTGFWRSGVDDGCTGTTLTDHSGNGNNMSLAGTAVFVSTGSLPTGIPFQAASTNGSATIKVTAEAGQSNKGGRANLYDYSPTIFAQRLQTVTWTSETADATDSGANDVQVMAAAELVGDTFYLGWGSTFNEFRMTNTSGTQGAAGTCAWEYCSACSGSPACACSTWTALSGLSDGTTCFTAARGQQFVSFTLPGDWVADSLNGSANQFHVRARVTGLYTTNPVYDWVVGDDDLVFANRAGTGIYDNDGPINAPNGTETPASESVDDITGQAAVFPISDDGSSAGPILPKLDYLAGQYPAFDWYAVPGPLGSTSAADWLPSHGQTASRLMGELESRLTPTALGASAEIVEWSVYQGEAECNNAVDASRWAERWAYGCEELRNWIGDRDVPCIFVRMPATVPSACNSTNWATIRAEQAAICTYLDHCAVVDAPNGPFAAPEGDTHLDHTAVRSLGVSEGQAWEATDLGGLF